ncbi:hypothetical protein ACROYT_G022320 [Oculina patagonica]
MKVVAEVETVQNNCKIAREYGMIPDDSVNLQFVAIRQDAYEKIQADQAEAVKHLHVLRAYVYRNRVKDGRSEFTSPTTTLFRVKKEGKISFLDTCVHVNQDGSTKISVYRKPTHTDQYLNFHSNHYLQHKRAVVNTLMLRAQTLVTGDEDKTRETQHVKQALKVNNYPDWMLTIPHSKSGTKDPQNEKKIYASAPYIKGISERLQRAFKSHEVTLIHKPVNSLRPVEAAPDIPATAATGTPITIPTPVSEVATAPEDRAAVTAPRQTTE